MAAHSFLLTSIYAHIRRSKVYTFTRKYFGLNVCYFTFIYWAFTNDSFTPFNSSSWSTVACQEGIWRRQDLPPNVLNFGTRWRRLISFTPRPIYPEESNPVTHLIGQSASHSCPPRPPPLKRTQVPQS
jgi:hypothetical protein